MSPAPPPQPRSDRFPDRPRVPGIPRPAGAATLPGHWVLIQGEPGGPGRKETWKPLRTRLGRKRTGLPGPERTPHAVRRPSGEVKVPVRPSVRPQKTRPRERTEREGGGGVEGEAALLTHLTPHVRVILHREHMLGVRSHPCTQILVCLVTRTHVAPVRGPGRRQWGLRAGVGPQEAVGPPVSG